jgi:hypothetical protein
MRRRLSQLPRGLTGGITVMLERSPYCPARFGPPDSRMRSLVSYTACRTFSGVWEFVVLRLRRIRQAAPPTGGG